MTDFALNPNVAEQPTVRVKPLVWEDQGNGWKMALGLGYEYWVKIYGNTSKQQANYEARILSAIEIDASQAPDPVIKPDPLENIVMRQHVGQEMIRLLQGTATPQWIETLQAFVKASDAWPAPTEADLDRAALARPVVRELVHWLELETRDIFTGETMYDDARPDIYVGDILERLSLIKEIGE